MQLSTSSISSDRRQIIGQSTALIRGCSRRQLFFYRKETMLEEAMTARQFATIVTRALAVFTVIQAVAYFPMIFSMVSAFDKLFEGSIVLGLVPPLLIWMPFFALAIWLWVKAAWFAERSSRVRRLRMWLCQGRQSTS